MKGKVAESSATQNTLSQSRAFRIPLRPIMQALQHKKPNLPSPDLQLQQARTTQAPVQDKICIEGACILPYIVELCKESAILAGAETVEEDHRIPPFEAFCKHDSHRRDSNPCGDQQHPCNRKQNFSIIQRSIPIP